MVSMNFGCGRTAPPGLAAVRGSYDRRMRLLLLGGTRFLSRRIAAEALAAGHDVICAARGVHGQPPAGATFVPWDRDQPAPDALASLHPDAVIDVTDRPAHASTAVANWPDAHWVFISTLNVYADVSKPGGSALDTPLVAPRFDDDTATDPAAYGAMKVACEKLVLDGAASSLVLRPGLIVGPGDPSGRFTYWPVHAREAAADGAGLLVPGTPDDAVQFIDVGDLARWCVKGAADRLTGCFDAVAPSMSRADFLAGLEAGIGARLNPVYVPGSWLLEQAVTEWMGPESIPLWIDDEEFAGMMARDVTASLAAGLAVTPVAETVRLTLDWADATPDAAVTGVTKSKERELLSRWASRATQ